MNKLKYSFLFFLGSFYFGNKILTQEKIIQLEEVLNIRTLTPPNSYTEPTWSPNGEKITYTTTGFNGIFIMNKDGSNNIQLTSETGAGYKYVWSLDNLNIAYRGTHFQGNERKQFIGVINLNVGQTKIVSNYAKRLQPPHWHYDKNTKQIIYVIDEQVRMTSSFSYKKNLSNEYVQKADSNKILHYRNGGLYEIKNGRVNEKIVDQGFDPVFSPDNKRIIYSKWNKLHVFNFQSKEDIDLGEGYHPSWSPDASKIVYQKSKDDGHKLTDSDLYILDLATMKRQQLTKTKEIFEVNPSWGPDGKAILFNDELTGVIYLINMK